MRAGNCMRDYVTTNNTPAHQAPPVWRAPEGLEDLTAAQVGGGGACQHTNDKPDRSGAPRGLRGLAAVPVGGGRAWPGFEIDHSEHSSRHGRRAGGAPHRRCGEHRGPGRGAGGRWQGLAGLRDRPLRAKLACGDLAGGAPPTGTNTQAQTLSHKRIGTTKPPGPTGDRAAHASGR